MYEMRVTEYVSETYCNRFPPLSFHQWFHLPAAAGENLVDCTASSQSPSAGALGKRREHREAKLKSQTAAKHESNNEMSLLSLRWDLMH